MNRSGEKWGWIGGWIGSFLWIGILSVIWLVQGKTVYGIEGILLFLAAMAAIFLCAPWRRPKTPYWKLMLPLYLCIALCVAVALQACQPEFEMFKRSPFQWFWVLFLLIPFWTAGRKTWD